MDITKQVADFLHLVDKIVDLATPANLDPEFESNYTNLARGKAIVLADLARVKLGLMAPEDLLNRIAHVLVVMRAEYDNLVAKLPKPLPN
jgi:hypothetical protein